MTAMFYLTFFNVLPLLELHIFKSFIHHHHHHHHHHVPEGLGMFPVP